MLTWQAPPLKDLSCFLFSFVPKKGIRTHQSFDHALCFLFITEAASSDIYKILGAQTLDSLLYLTVSADKDDKGTVNPGNHGLDSNHNCLPPLVGLELSVVFKKKPLL